ncbi:MAG: CbbQ/NirQ/NorQ C-terminal domain-containing protein, partial [Gemmatimonadetes bacterium]|nr:CbbQ/NirQ/NorQ C-terminal domain-containing protein [Gemmatimonadota bacterium]
RRLLPIDKTGELIEAAPGFQLVISYNPGYQHALKDLKPSTRQRFVALEFDFPPAEREAEIVAHEGGVDRATAAALVRLAGRVRNLRDQGLAEAPSTRLLVSTARLIAGGISAPEACRVGLVGPLTDDPDLLAAISDLIAATL